jgi:hypothetical protein
LEGASPFRRRTKPLSKGEWFGERGSANQRNTAGV